MAKRSRPTLYDPRTAAAVRREHAPSRVPVLALAALACGGLVAVLHHELPLLAHWAGACSPDQYAYECETRGRWDAIAAGVATALFGALFAIGHRLGPFPPTLTCRGCRTSGWVLDIEPSHGRCPRCGTDRFEYRIWQGGAGTAGPRIERVHEPDVAGADLVRRFHETRRSATRRYF